MFEPVYMARDLYDGSRTRIALREDLLFSPYVLRRSLA